MKINSEKLFEFVNNLGTDEKVKFKVFEDDNYVTEIYWDGENFNWEPGTFTSGMLFNPLVDFVEVKEEKKMEKLDIELNNGGALCLRNEEGTLCGMNKHSIVMAKKINEIIDKINSMEVNK